MSSSSSDSVNRTSRNRAHCFTINNYTPSSLESLSLLGSNPITRYLIFGKEKGESGTPHLQGYVSWFKAKTFASVVSLFPGAHISIAKGDAQSNRTYCSKEGDFQEYGEIPKTRQESSAIGGAATKLRWDSALECAKRGDLSPIPSDIVIRYYSTLKRIAVDFVQRPSDRASLENYWFYGSSGSGKSSHARKLYPTAYSKPRTKWWDGYQNQKEVIIDDLDPYNVGLGGLIKDWADHYPFPAEVKCGSILIRPAVIVITSQYQPEQIWNDSETVAAIRRRFKFTVFRTGFLPGLPNSPPPSMVTRRVFDRSYD